MSLLTFGVLSSARLRQPTTDVIALNRVDATNVGRLLAASATADIVDSHLALAASNSRS
ncbi:MAG: hypothetical protein ACRDZ8_10775 [Acidimicrobiales bacterium]